MIWQSPICRVIKPEWRLSKLLKMWGLSVPTESQSMKSGSGTARYSFADGSVIAVL